MDAADRKLLQQVFEISIRNETSLADVKQRLFGQTGNNGFVGKTEERLSRLESGAAKVAGAVIVVSGLAETLWHKILGK